MLGLLGTFVGMVATLQGAVAALEGTTELEALREGLTAPIKGLGMAFGTSVAGVSASAALGFVATLARRERFASMRLLDSVVAGRFQSYTHVGYREQVLETLAQQSELLPELVAQIATQNQRLGEFSREIDEKLSAGQAKFHRETATIYRELADSVGQSLKESLAESGRLAGESIRPITSDAMASIVSATRETQAHLSATNREQAEEISRLLAKTVSELNTQWVEVSEQQRGAQQTLVTEIGGEVGKLGGRIDSGLETILSGFAGVSQQMSDARSREQQIIDEHQQLLTGMKSVMETLDQQAVAQCEALETKAAVVADSIATLSGKLVQASSDQQEVLASGQKNLNERLSGQYEDLTQTIADKLAAIACDHSERTLSVLEPVIREVMSAITSESAVTHKAITENTVQNLRVLDDNLQSLSAVISEKWSTALASQQALNSGFVEDAGKAVNALQERFETSTTALVSTISTLQDAGAANMEREVALQREQSALVQQFVELAGSITANIDNQQKAIDALTANARQLLENIGNRVEQQVSSETGKLSEATEGFSVSALELASLGDALVQVMSGFGNANEQLSVAASSLVAAIDSAAQRSDEQMSYYVAQAREVIDHSVLAQQELIEQMRQLSRKA